MKCDACANLIILTKLCGSSKLRINIATSLWRSLIVSELLKWSKSDGNQKQIIVSNKCIVITITIAIVTACCVYLFCVDNNRISNVDYYDTQFMKLTPIRWKSMSLEVRLIQKSHWIEKSIFVPFFTGHETFAVSKAAKYLVFNFAISLWLWFKANQNDTMEWGWFDARPQNLWQDRFGHDLLGFL